MVQTWLTREFGLKTPIIMAPMFLVSNASMLIEAYKAGIMGCVPSLNYRTPDELRAAMREIKAGTNGVYGINLIVNKSNIHLKAHLDICAEEKPAFIITSLGSPQQAIEMLKPKGVRIFCDVVDLDYAKKVEGMGADAVIAVNSGAGGHAGPIPSSILVPMLKANCKLPVISAGGVGTGAGLLSVMALGAEGVSIGSPFIATLEAPVSEAYKKACVDYGAKDIVMTTKLSGTPCSIIKTPYVEKIGTKQNFLEAYLNQNKQLKKYAKMLTSYKGMKSLEKAAFSASYKSVWCAGPSIEFTEKIESVKSIVARLESEYESAWKEFEQKHKGQA